jgi:multidrug efflux pump subunit AcrA (membrane-fusion protein)
MVVSADGAAHKHLVTLGIQTPGDVQVLDGLSPTDTVITTGAYGLDDGTKVKIGAPGEGDAKPSAEKKDEK